MKFYIVNMSHGPDVPIDEDELEYVLMKMAAGKYAICKQGIINPSYYASITEDQIRKGGYQRDLGREIYIPTSKAPLPDLFSDMREKILSLSKDAVARTILPKQLS